MATRVMDGTGATYARFTTANVQLYAGGYRGLSVTSTGGTLHGAWSADATVTTSDRRLKKNIEPLYRTLAATARKRWDLAGGSPDGELQLRGAGRGQAVAPSSRQSDPTIGWLLRELRPVSFYLKRGPEAKYLKFGFIAQELETVFPNLVRTVGEDQTKAVASQDLIAVLTLALQSLQKELEDYRRLLDEQQARVERLERAVFAAQSV